MEDVRRHRDSLSSVTETDVALGRRYDAHAEELHRFDAACRVESSCLARVRTKAHGSVPSCNKKRGETRCVVPSSDPDPFRHHVLRSFAFLAEQRFELLDEPAPQPGGLDWAERARFSSPAGLLVELYHSKRPGDEHYRLTVRRTDPPGLVTAGDMLRFSDGWRSPYRYCATPEERQRVDLDELARQLREFGASALVGDPAIYDFAARRRTEYTRTFAKDPVDDE